MNNSNLKILLLEDVEYDARILEEYLKSTGFNIRLDWVSRQEDLIGWHNNHKYDIILSDFNLPGFSGLEALKLSNLLAPEVPFICVSGIIGEERAVELMHMGAADYVSKNRLEKLPVSIKRVLNEAREKASIIVAERMLQQSEERMRDIIMSSYDWIWETDKHWSITYTSEQVEPILGYNPGEITGKSLVEFMYEEERRKFNVLRRSIINEKCVIKELEIRCMHKTGKEVWVMANGFPFFDKEGNSIGYRGVGKDITDQKRMITELVEAKEKAEKSDRLKTAFLNNISHEIRTPLSGILGVANTLFLPGLGQEEKETYLKLLDENSERLLITINNYIDISLIMTGNLRLKSLPLNIPQILNNAKEKFMPRCCEKKIGFNIVSVNCINTRIYGDQELLEKAVFHLVDNAVKFTVSGSVTLGARFRDDKLVFSIKDTGPGIDVNSQNRIFEPFIQEDTTLSRGFEGNGLGLSIANGIIRLMGGSIDVKSEAGRGSIFSIELYNSNTKISEEQTFSENQSKSRMKAPGILTSLGTRAARVLNY